MWRLASGVLFLLVPAEFSCPQPSPTTWLIVRHADRAGEQDALTAAGERRAQQLALLAQLLRVSAVYSTDTERTRRTAQPTADALHLGVSIYGRLSEEWFEELKTLNAGKTVLIVAHSNTAGAIARGLGGDVDVSIDDEDFDDLFIVTTGEQGGAAVRLKYGGPVDWQPQGR